MAKDVVELLNNLNIQYNDIDLYRSAFTHVSYKNEHSDSLDDYDRLEFVGDGVLDLIIATLIYKRFPSMRSGELSKCRSSLVMGPTLTSFSRKMHFDKYVLLSKGEEREGVKDKILEDVFEAFIGAYYLDHENNFELTKKLVISFFQDSIENYKILEQFDYKSKLQEIIQASGKGEISYIVLSETGTAQDKHFKIEVRANGVSLGVGEGSSKKKAEQQAAKSALEKRV